MSATRPKLIYLPGMDGTGDLFYRQTEQLAATFDIRTFSFNAHPVRSWSYLAERVRQQHLADGPAILCAESFGGCIALTLATHFPQSVAGLILVNPASAFRQSSLTSNIVHLLKLVPEIVFEACSELALSWLAELSRLAQGDRDRFLAAIRAVNKTSIVERLTLLGHFDPAALPLEAIRQPTLLLASERDRILPSVREAHSLAQRIPNSTVQLLPHSGHACLLEEEFDLLHIARSARWLDRVLASGAHLG